MKDAEAQPGSSNQAQAFPLKGFMSSTQASPLRESESETAPAVNSPACGLRAAVISRSLMASTSSGDGSGFGAWFSNQFRHSFNTSCEMRFFFFRGSSEVFDQASQSGWEEEATAAVR